MEVEINAKKANYYPLFLLVKYYISSVNYGLSLFNVQLFGRTGDRKAKVPLSIVTINPIQALTCPGALLQGDIPL